MSSTMIAPTTPPTNPALSPGRYHPRAWPKYVATNAPTIPKILVRMKPEGSLSPGMRNLAITPTIKPMIIVHSIPISHSPFDEVPTLRYGPRSRQCRLILLRHNFLSSVCYGVAAATRTSWQSFDERVDQANAHGCDRVRNVAFRPQGRIPWVDNRRVRQASGTAWRYEVLRGESSPARRSKIRRPRCTSWRGDGSRATRGLRSAQARLPA